VKIKMHVELEKSDGKLETFDVVSDARDIRGYEAEFKESWIATELSFTQMSQLAWITARRARKFSGSYDVWDAEAVDVSSSEEDEGEVETADPTRRARTAKS